MGLKSNKNSSYKELNFIVSEAMDKLKKGLLSEQEYISIILNVEKEVKNINDSKKENTLNDFFWRIIN
ncbi:hypothetical protein GOQ30_11480 [Flavobacterium sp. TP390]|uniref:Uncharacterized protein n=1 Tax=Flavobacterium profundi TaxID=1774945 RepID=A0A6I4IJ55_9FLAO|nr:hypothetical protein [Flavobacterium profundi]MVO09780.1 hypothetical protein [Flavobacterium profundi]